MKKILLLLIFNLYFVTGFSQKNQLWIKNTEENTARKQKIKRSSDPKEKQIYTLNIDLLKSKLSTATERSGGKKIKGLVIPFPNSSGEMENYQVFEASIMHPDLAARYPDIKSYVGLGVGNSNRMRFSISPLGLHTMNSSGKNGTEYIDPFTTDLNEYAVYSKNQVEKTNDFECQVIDNTTYKSNPSNKTLSADGLFRTYRLAVSTTVEYSNYHIEAAGLNSGTTAQKRAAVLAAINVTMTRVNGLFEKDLSLTLQLVANNDILISIGTDSFNNGSGSALLSQNQIFIDNNLGDFAYDIGHIFSTGGGGVAYLGSVCLAGSKAGGVTGSTAPVNDTFDVDYVAHEMGHQFGATHTFNNSCGGNRSSFTAIEPGSGSTIMGYAGICNPNVQNNSDDHFSVASLIQINEFVNTDGSCAITTNNNNPAPVINSLTSYTIPFSTAFVLKGNATDTNNSALTYCWEQTNNEISTQPPLSDNISGPNFQSLRPSNSPDRYMPMLSNVAENNLTSQWEVVPSVARTMDFSLTVRDNSSPNGGQTAISNMSVTTANVGPFTVTSQNTFNTIWAGNSNQTITWDVAGTNANGINTTDVRILLSTDGGLTFTTVLSGSTPNDGSETITVPNNINATNCRLIVESVGNIFYAANTVNFAVAQTLGNEDFELKGFAMYPNPNKGNFTVQFDSDSQNKINIQVFDMSGRTIFDKSYGNSGLFLQNIQLNNTQAGIYLLNVNDGNKKTIRKIILE